MKPLLTAVAFVAVLTLSGIALSGTAQAQGAAIGTKRGMMEGDRVGGPVGAALGGAIGGMVGGAAGVLGDDPGSNGYRTNLPTRAGYVPPRMRHHRHHHHRRHGHRHHR